MASTEELLAGYPPALELTPADTLAVRGPGTAQLIVIDDHPTGSQSMVDVPVLTAWSPDLIEWALKTDAPAIFIVTGSRALSAPAAEDRYVEVMTAVLEVATQLRRPVTFALRTDSSLRSHYPLDSDVVVNAIESTSATRIDGVILVAAFPEARRVTVGAIHHVSEWEGTWTPIGDTRFAREPNFPYTTSDLRAWVIEKTRGRYQQSDILHVALGTVRESPDAVAAQLMNAHDAQPVVVDAVTEEDLRSVAIGVLQAVAAGKHFVYRASPPFVRALVGQPVPEPFSVSDVAALRAHTGAAPGHGLVIVGTPVPFTRRQVRVLVQRRPIRDIVLSVPALLDARREAHLEEVVRRAVEGLTASNVLLRLTDMSPGTDGKGDFSIDARVARAVNELVFQISKRSTLGFVVARGGSIVGPVAQGLGVRRAMVRGPMLPGIVSLWEPLVGKIKGVPFAVYAGGVGDDDGLADVADKLSGINPPTKGRHAEPASPHVPPAGVAALAVIGLGSKGLGISQRLGERFPVRAWDSNPHARDVARLAGVGVAESAAAAVDGVSVVLIAVRDGDDLSEVLDGAAGIRGVLVPGTVVCLLMALAVDEIREFAAALGEAGIHVVDAPVSGGGELARRGQIACLVGGPTAVVGSVQEVLEQMAATVVVAGDAVGDGQAMKAVVQLAGAVNLLGTAEALALAGSLGLDRDVALGALLSGSGGSFMAADRGPRMVQAASSVSPQLVNRMDLTGDDLAVALDIAREYGVATPVAAAAEQVMLRAARMVNPDADDSEVIRAVEQH